jgi:hypothetical protein
LGQLEWDFDNGKLNDDCVENGDETHFCVNIDNEGALQESVTKKSGTLMSSQVALE